MSGIDSGVDFNFTFASGVTDEQIIGFELAAEIWSQYLTDSYTNIENVEEFIDVNIHVEIGDDLLPENIIGGAFPKIETVKYEDVYDALFNDVTSDVDLQAVDSLLDRKTLDILVGQDVVEYNYEMRTTRANLKAIGLVEGDSEQLDGYIVMNSLANTPVSWSYDYVNAAKPDTLDFLSTALHEIGHTLGFVSGIDYSGDDDDSLLNELINLNDWTREIASYFEVDSNAGSITATSIMDLYRVSVESEILGITTLTEGEAATFSLDQSFSELAFATGADYQASHWINSVLDSGLGIMNPTLGLGERWSISDNDLTVIDAIGWDIDYTAEIDLEALFSSAQLTVENAAIVDRVTDIDTILNTEAYNWSSRSSSSSSTGWWWSSRSSSSSSTGWWQTGYWSTYDTEDDTVTTSEEFSISDLLSQSSTTEQDTLLTTNTEESNNSDDLFGDHNFWDSWGSWGSWDSDDSED